MHKIPYVFRAIPDEFLTEDFLSDPIMIRLIAWMMKRIYPYPHNSPYAKKRAFRLKRKLPRKRFREPPHIF